MRIIIRMLLLIGHFIEHSEFLNPSPPPLTYMRRRGLTMEFCDAPLTEESHNTQDLFRRSVKITSYTFSCHHTTRSLVSKSFGSTANDSCQSKHCDLSNPSKTMIFVQDVPNLRSVQYSWFIKRLQGCPFLSTFVHQHLKCDCIPTNSRTNVCNVSSAQHWHLHRRPPVREEWNERTDLSEKVIKVSILACMGVLSRILLHTKFVQMRSNKF